MYKTPDDIQLRLVSFEQLPSQQLYALLQLRSAVFVLEQQCIYQDLDGLDQAAMHLMVSDATPALVAYARILPPAVVFPEAAIGRVLTSEQWRGKGYGRWLIDQSIKCTQQLYPGTDIRIGAQAHLQSLYQACGFTAVGNPYDEDGILHVEMLLQAQ